VNFVKSLCKEVISLWPNYLKGPNIFYFILKGKKQAFHHGPLNDSSLLFFSHQFPSNH
jgi:hypothetical protein